MALNRIMAMLYVIDILYYAIIDDSWGIGVVNCIYCGKQLTFIDSVML